VDGHPSAEVLSPDAKLLSGFLQPQSVVWCRIRSSKRWSRQECIYTISRWV